MAFLTSTLIAAGIGAAGAVGAAALSNKGAKTAANAATKSTAETNALQREIYSSNKTTLTPFINSGVGANKQIDGLLKTNPFNYDPGQFEADPGYQFRLQQGMQGVQQANAASNTRLSGSAQKALLGYGQGMAAQEYGNWWNRDQSRIAGENNVQTSYLNALGGQQATGLSAGNALAGVGTQYAGQVGQNNQWQANQVGNAALVNGNNQANLIGGVANMAGNALGQWAAGRGSSYNSNGSPIIPAPIRSVFN